MDKRKRCEAIGFDNRESVSWDHENGSSMFVADGLLHNSIGDIDDHCWLRSNLKDTWAAHSDALYVTCLRCASKKLTHPWKRK